MNNELAKAYSEIDEILLLMESKYVEKIPQKMRDMFRNEKLIGYEPKIDKYTPLDEQKLQRKTFVILSILNLNYWCEDEEEKQKLISAYAENDRVREAELREKYNPDKIFQKKTLNSNDNIEENTQIAEYIKPKFIESLWRKIIKLFKKK